MAKKQKQQTPPWRMTLDEWKAEGKRLFGDDPRQFKYVCPTCGYVNSAQDLIDKGIFKEEETKKALNAAYCECIGRHTDSEIGCNWCAYGLFCSPYMVVTPNGKETHVFDFYRGE